MKTIKYVGSGLTKTEVLQFSGVLSADEQTTMDELAALHTLEGRLAHIEETCALVLKENRLPTESGRYLCDRVGNWEIATELRYGWTFTHSPWTIAQRQGHAADSPVGFAAQMLDDIHYLGERRASGDDDGALMMMFYLGVKWASAGIKQGHGKNSRPHQPNRKRARDVRMAQEFLRRKQTLARAPESARRSDSVLMTEIGSEQTPSLGRSSAIAAIKRGLNFLSG